jgi:hypothetical protein
MVLNNEEFSAKGGGGLGLIDIVRRTENKIEFDFQKINNIFSFYFFKVVV